MSSTPVNLKTLSQHLGLSQTTVSRALNGFPEVNEKTRARVLAAAAELNYRPSPSAASLATGKARIIGHVVQVSDHRMINPHFADFLAGAGEIYSAAGYDLLLRMVGPNEEENIYRDFVSRKRVDGVVVHGPKIVDRRIELLQSLKLPFVVHGRCGREDTDYAWLDVNNKGAFEAATDLLLNQGHSRIGLINGLESMSFAHRRRSGYEAALARHGIATDESLIRSADMTEHYGYDATRELMNAKTPPTALLYASVLCAIGGVRALNECGLKAGTDVALVTFDDELSFLQSADESADEPFFTCLRSSIHAAGKRVAEILIDQIANPSTPVVQERWEAQLIEGRTTRQENGQPR